MALQEILNSLQLSEVPVCFLKQKTAMTYGIQYIQCEVHAVVSFVVQFSVF